MIPSICTVRSELDVNMTHCKTKERWKNVTVEMSCVLILVLSQLLWFPFFSSPACSESETGGPERGRNNSTGAGVRLKLAALTSTIQSNGNLAKTTISREIPFLTAVIQCANMTLNSCLIIPFHHYSYPPQNLTPNQANEGFEAAPVLTAE